MRSFQTTLSGIGDDEFEVPTVVSTPQLPTQYQVQVRKVDDQRDTKQGFVVSFLDIEDWCLMKGWELLKLLPGTRQAHYSERTELF